MLNQIHHGAPGGTPLIIVHGLYGSARNWGVIGKRLSENRHVIAVEITHDGQLGRVGDIQIASLPCESLNAVESGGKHLPPIRDPVVVRIQQQDDAV